MTRQVAIGLIVAAATGCALVAGLGADYSILPGADGGPEAATPGDAVTGADGPDSNPGDAAAEGGVAQDSSALDSAAGACPGNAPAPNSLCTMFASNCTVGLFSLPSDQNGDDATPHGITLDGTSVYWAAAQALDAGGGLGVIKRQVKTPAGMAPDVIARVNPGPDSVAVDDTFVYWVTPDDGNVYRLAKDAPACSLSACPATPELLGTSVNAPTSIALGNGVVFVAGRDVGDFQPRPDGGFIFDPVLNVTCGNGYPVVTRGSVSVYTACANGIFQMPLDGTSESLFVNGGGSATPLIVSDCTEVFAEPFDGSMLAFSQTDGGGRLVAQSGLVGLFTDMAVDGTFVYLASSRALYRTPRDGSGTPELVYNNVDIAHLAVDTATVYMNTTTGVRYLTK